MPKFLPGDIIDVSIKSARVVADDGFNLVVSFETTTGETGSVQLRPDGHGINVDHVARGDWPPQPGDLWESGHDGTYPRHFSVFAHEHARVCEQVGCDYTVDLVDADQERYSIGSTVPVALRPLELIHRPTSPTVAA